MKFSCERCGKKYATADKPVPGRVYKLKCKACGHVIVVRPTAEASAAARTPAPAPGALPPEVTLEIGVPEPETPPPAPLDGAPVNGATSAVHAPLPRASEPTQEVSSALLGDDGFKLKAGDTGYVDLFADAAAPAPAAPPPAAADPFAAAADAGPVLDKDPFADVRAELAAVEAAEAKADTSPLLPTPKVPEIPKPPPQKTGSPVLLIGAGVLVMVGILVFALVNFRGQKPDAAPAQASAAPAAVPAPPPAAAAVAEPPKPASEPPPAPPPVVDEAPKAAPVRAEVRREPPRPEPKRRPEPRTARAEAKPAPKPEPVAQAAPPPPPPREQRNVDLPDVPEGLTQDQIQKVLSSTRKAFDDCIATAGKKSDVKLDGRRVVLRLNIQPNGTVTYPTIDDIQLSGTPLGGCLKQTARLMVFPKFSGDPLRIEVPLVLNAR